MRPLTDGERDILRELNADARYTQGQLDELADECETFGEMLCEIADAELYTPNEWHAFGECFPDANGDDIPY